MVSEKTFQCVHGQRSWEFLDLEIAPSPQIQEDQALNGIFILKRERLSGFAHSIRHKSTFLRQENIDAASISKLDARIWVNDEIINGYIKLLNSKTPMLVVNTFFYTFLSRGGILRSETIFAYVSYTLN